MMVKRLFQKIPVGASGVFRLTNTPSVCADLVWLSQRYALDVEPARALFDGADAHQEHLLRMDQIVDPGYTPRPFDLALPARIYQRQAAELYLSQGHLLLADDVGLGKTCSAICSLTDERTLPAVVVCMAHLPRQWEREIHRFAPDLSTHIIRQGTPYELPRRKGRGPDVLICSYYKLDNWSTVLARYCNSVIFDECQELRRDNSNKYRAAERLAEGVQFRLGLSATPIYNYGGEIFNILNVISPGALGAREEFIREWCVDEAFMGDRRKVRLRDPDAFGSWAREQHLMLRRTRKDVSRELPDLTTITHEIDSDRDAIRAVEGRAGELARILLSTGPQARGERMRAAEEFSNVLRQATGIAKAPYVAAFVRLLVEQGEPVVLFGWHRAVYEIWQQELKEFDPAIYTGSESPAAKQTQAQRFTSGETPLMIVSLRSGAGLDGLQHRARTIVFGELDWSPGVHEQCIGRVHRDGQADPTFCYFLMADDGADPYMAQALGLKREQIDGIRGSTSILQRNDSPDILRKLAEAYLRK